MPEPAPVRLPRPPSGDQFTAFCDGPASDNGFYGDGIVNALDAVRK